MKNNARTRHASLLVLVFFAVYLEKPFAQTSDVATGLIGYWPFDGGSLNDFSGNNNNLVPISANCAGGFAPGVSGLARSVSSCGGLAVNSFSFYNQTSELSVSLWFNASSSQQQTYNALFYRANRFVNSPSSGWTDRTIAVFWRNPGGLHLTYTSSGAAHQEECYNNDLGLAINKWHHVVATISGATRTAKLYVNGSVVKTCSMLGQALMAGTVALNLGQVVNGQLGDTGGFNGALDQIRYYERTITEGEVDQIYREERDLIFRNGFE